MLVEVGPAHADVLIEAIVCLALAPHVYLIAALKRVAGEEHKAAILTALVRSPDLVDVVVARGWTSDAAPVLLEVLARRAPDLSLGWILAAARVARPEDYDNLRFQVARGLNPYETWLGIRSLPGMEPLAEFVRAEWSKSSRRGRIQGVDPVGCNRSELWRYGRAGGAGEASGQSSG